MDLEHLSFKQNSDVLSQISAVIPLSNYSMKGSSSSSSISARWILGHVQDIKNQVAQLRHQNQQLEIQLRQQVRKIGHQVEKIGHHQRQLERQLRQQSQQMEKIGQQLGSLHTLFAHQFEEQRERKNRLESEQSQRSRSRSKLRHKQGRHKKISEEEKISLVNDILNGVKSNRSVAEAVGVTERTIRRWVQKIKQPK